jgi:sugar phosphate isomerase/epimerase
MINTELLASCWTSAGDAAPLRGDETSPIPLRTRIETAGRVGWEGFGLLHSDLHVALRTMGLADLRKIFDDSGIKHVELEFLPDWWTDDKRRGPSDELRTLLLEAAPILGVKAIKIGGELGDLPVEPHRFHEEFDLLATQAGEAGTRVAIEPMPMSNLASIPQGVEFVTEVGNPHGGLTIDVWHVHRSGMSYADLPAVLPLEYVFVVEIDDAAAEVTGTLWEDTIDHRLLPGEGSFDVPSFVTTMHDLGWRGYWGVEVISQDFRVLPIDEALTAARRAALGTITEAQRRLGG